MRVTSAAIINGEFENKYGKWGGQLSPNGMSTYSILFEIGGAPEGTKSSAMMLEDKDAATASGLVWIRWLIVDLEHTSVMGNEGVSVEDYVQGVNSWTGALGKSEAEEASYYSGVTPPNRRHRHELIVYALDTKLNLPRGFRFNDPHFAVQGHVLVSASMMRTYDV